MQMKPAYAGPAILLVIAIGLLIGGISPAWWIVLLVAIGVFVVLLITGKDLLR